MSQGKSDWYTLKQTREEESYAPSHHETEGNPEHNRESLTTEYPFVEEQNTTFSKSKGKIARKINDEFTL